MGFKDLPADKKTASIDWIINLISNTDGLSESIHTETVDGKVYVKKRVFTLTYDPPRYSFDLLKVEEEV